MMTVHELVAAHGHQRLAELLQASPTAISNMKRDNRIPAKKYRLAQRAAVLAGLGPVPDELFSFDRAQGQGALGEAEPRVDGAPT